MVEFRESSISAHHNYLVNGILSPGFFVGRSGRGRGFYFLADLVLPGESTPRISARVFDEEGFLLFELNWNRIGRNPGGYAYLPMASGFSIVRAPESPILEVMTQHFANGFLTRVRGRFHDENGRIRMEPLGDSIQVHGEAILVLDRPFANTADLVL